VGGDSPVRFQSLILFAEQEQTLKDIADEAIKFSEKPLDKSFDLYSWSNDDISWVKLSTKRARNVESVVLPKKLEKNY